MIVYSHELFSIQSYGGVTRCMIELMRAINRQEADWLVWAGTHGSEPLEFFRCESDIAEHVVAKSIRSLPGRLRASSINEWRFRTFLQQHARAIIHRTQYAAYDMAPRRHPRVSTLHDMWTERRKPSLGEQIRSGFKRRALEASDAIVCVSEHSRQAMIEVWPHLGARAITIHHGARPVSEWPVPAGEPRPYFLFVGSRENRKNFSILIKSLAIAPRLRSFDLLCVGGGHFSEEELQLITDTGLSRQIRQRNATDNELAGLYESAVALVYPSTFEGFGMPLVEAMIHKCPVIAAPLTSLPEIGGNAALYACAHEPEQWRHAMEQVAFDGEAAAEMRQRGLDRARLFSWEQSARQHMNVYASLA